MSKPTTKDNTKPPLADMLADFSLALTEVARVTAYGNSQPGRSPGSWRSVPDFRRKYQNAKARHAITGLTTELDGESGLHHLAHEAWNALALLQHRLEGMDGVP